MKREPVPCDRCMQTIPKDGPIYEEWTKEGMFYYCEPCTQFRQAEVSNYYESV